MFKSRELICKNNQIKCMDTEYPTSIHCSYTVDTCYLHTLWERLLQKTMPGIQPPTWG